MRRRAMLGLLGTASVAGCLRLEGGSENATTTGDAGGVDTSTGTETSGRETATEAPATTEEPDTETERPGEVTYPIGVSDDGVNEFLFDAHTRALTETTAQLSWRKLNHTEGSIDWERTYDVGSGAALGEWTTDEGGRVSMYRSGDSALWRENRGDEVVYGEDAVGFAWRRVSWGVELKPALAAFDWGAPERVNDDRPAEWAVTATAVADASSAPGYHAETVESLEEASMRVTEDGIIRELHATYTISEGDGGQTLSYESTFETTAVGDVSVREPSWVSTARDRIPTASVSYAEDRQFVEFTLESGGPLVSDSRIVLVPESGPPDRREVELDESLEAGTTAYIWHDESDPFREARISRGSPPSNASPITLPNPLEVYMYRDALLYAPPETVS